MLGVFRGRGAAGDTTGNSLGTIWVALNAIAEHLDYGPRYTSTTTRCSAHSRTRQQSTERSIWCSRLNGNSASRPGVRNARGHEAFF